LKARILVADDDRVTARFLQSLLSEKGYDVAVAEDGGQALELAATLAPDLILSDMVMPYVDGMSLLRQVRSDERLAGIPVILLTQKDREEDIVAGLEGGADDYVVKPFNARELLVRVRKLLERAGAA
jgi:two-component system response regulator ResD